MVLKLFSFALPIALNNSFGITLINNCADRCDVKFLAPDRTVISHCETGRENPQIAERIRLEELHSSFVWQLGQYAQLVLIYVRVIALLSMAVAAVVHSPVAYIMLFWIAFTCDLLSRYNYCR